MKKLFAFVVFTLSVCQLGAWTYVTINNDTEKKVEFSTESIKKDIPARKIYRIINPNYSKNPLVTNTTNKIILKKNENWFKIGEKTHAAGRTYTIAPRIDIGENVTSAMIKVKTVLNNKPLPKGFEYHKYAMGLREKTPAIIAAKTTTQEPSTPRFLIENDTFYKITLSTCDSDDKIEIKPITKNSEENKLIPGDTFTINPVSYKNYKAPEGMMYATRYKIVDKENMFRLEIQINGTIHKFTIQIKPELVPETILKISNLIGFEVQAS